MWVLPLYISSLEAHPQGHTSSVKAPPPNEPILLPVPCEGVASRPSLARHGAADLDLRFLVFRTEE